MRPAEGQESMAGSRSADPTTAALRKRLPAARFLRASGLVWVLAGMCLAAALISDAFLNPFNLINVARQVALFGIVSIGMTFVILTAGIDLSVGSIVAVVAVVSALLLNDGTAVPLVIIAALAIGLALGAVNGVGITLGRLPPFIMTLGTMVMGRGLAMTISDGHPIHFPAASADFAWLGQGHLLGLPVPVWIFAAVAATAYVVLRYTIFGRNVFAVGSNPEAARLAYCQARHEDECGQRRQETADRIDREDGEPHVDAGEPRRFGVRADSENVAAEDCLLYTSDAADEL